MFVDSPTHDKVIGCATNACVNRYNKKIKSMVGSEEYEVGDLLVLQAPWWRFYSKDTQANLHNGAIVKLTKIEDSYPDYYVVSIMIGDKLEVDDIILPKKQYIHKELLFGILKECQQKKRPWVSYYEAKNETLNVKHIFSASLWKLQGTTVDEVYLDIKDIRTILHWKGTATTNKDMLLRTLYVGASRARHKIILKV